MKTNPFTIRPARPEEAGLVLEYIKKIAAYEKCSDEVVADEATIYHSLFVEHSAEVVFGEEDGNVVGFALFFHNFSTFVGRKGLYLEDLFILPEKRGRGYGKALLKYLAKLAVERNCGRMEWICLDWNEPALKVYRSIGAIPMDEWTVQRLTEPALKMTFEACGDDDPVTRLLGSGNAFLRIADGTAGLDFGGKSLVLYLDPLDFERGYWRRMKGALV